MIYIHHDHVPPAPSPEKLQAALHLAIGLEHATIPIYLYALYSLDPKRNAESAALIQSIAREEMLHMLLACNVLNAIGGEPALDTKEFIPVFPCPLPGTIAGGLTVGLERFSLGLVERVFMAIEEPDHPLKFGGASLTTTATHMSIHKFYGAIKDRIRAGGERLFTGDRRRQVVYPQMKDLVAVTDVASALAAIDIIVEQGEGTPDSPLDPDQEYAHYYRLAEIVNQRALHPTPIADAGTLPKDRYRYSGRRIPFESTGVWGVRANPKAGDYAPGSRERRACDNFNYAYTSLLRGLHAVVNGAQERLPATIGLMFSLRQQGMDMMSGASTGGTPVGPSFEYQPLNPE
jgi:hypothetical protein